MRILVCGGRDYFDYAKACIALDRAHAKRPISVIIQGGAKGADMQAKNWARNRGVMDEQFDADWNQGKKAGPIRNQRMINEGKPDGAIAFPGGKGTADMIKRLEAAGVPVWKPYGQP